MLNFSKDIAVKIKTDVFIAGGGPAGVAAALACAKQGKRVFLAEAGGCFGGSSTSALVPELMNFDDGENFLSGGVGRTVHDRLFDDVARNRKWYVVKSETIKRLYDELITAAGVDFLFYSKVADVVTDGSGRVKYAVLSGKKGIYAAAADVFIDCTGDGSLSAWAGADFEYGGENGAVAGATLCSVWGGIDFSKKDFIFDGCKYGEAYAKGYFSQYDGILPGIKPTHPEVGVGGGNVGHLFHVDDTDERSLTEAMLYGRKNVLEYERYYRDFLPGFDKATLLETANVLGVRESRRIIGDIVMNYKHFLDRQVFDDEIGRYSYPIDIHPETADQKGAADFTDNVSKAYAPGESYGISYRALTPKKLQNVLVAGRCISADRSMQASMRVIPCCYITGQAAGAAAACVRADGDVHSVNIKEVQMKLKELGAYLPNFQGSY